MAWVWVRRGKGEEGKREEKCDLCFFAAGAGGQWCSLTPVTTSAIELSPLENFTRLVLCPCLFPSTFASLDDWIAREAISFALDSSDSFNAAVDKVVAVLGDSVELLGLGEPTHMAEDFLVFRNRMFQRLVEAAWLPRHCSREQFSAVPGCERIRARSWCSIV